MYYLSTITHFIILQNVEGTLCFYHFNNTVTIASTIFKMINYHIITLHPLIFYYFSCE